MRWSFVWLGITVARLARADVQLAWHAPAACPDGAAMRAAILQHVEDPVDQIELAVTVEVVVAPEGFVAHVTTADETRELASASCSELAEAVAVVVARAAVDRHVAPPVTVPVIAVPVVRVAAPVPIVRPAAWNAGVRVAALAGNGFSPELGVAGEVAAWVSYHRFDVELGGSRWAATTADVGSNAGVEVGLSALALRLGWAPAERVRAWVVGELGAQHGTGVGFSGSSEGSGRWVAAGGGAGLVWPLAPHVAAVAAGELEVAIERTDFAVSGMTVYEAPRLAERVRLGVELRWR